MSNFSTQEELALLRSSLNVLPFGVLITDCQQDDDPIVYVNESFLRMSGYERAEVIGRNCRFMQGQCTDQEELEKLTTALHQNEPVSVTIINCRKNGEKFFNQLSIYPIKDQHGTVTHRIGIQQEL